MPTPVSAARQCLTEEAARALDDAVAVARRRNHAQTTSLHAISALLALPSSTLRDACTRARSCSYSPRLHFKALELSVGVSLDRLPTTKALEDDPPISNSLMAAIKRSQANQRRHPESFHLIQMHMHQQQQTASFLKVELKHFILSILDDPIVNRVFGEAGFRSCDIKLALLQPPIAQASARFFRSRYPPLFLGNLTGLEMDRSGFNFPFMANPGREDGDENCRRIAEVFVRKTKKNPLLTGAYAKGALRRFTDSVQRGRVGMLPADIAGVKMICIEREIAAFFIEGGCEEKMVLKFKELTRAVEQCSGPGIVVNFGELEPFVGDGAPGVAVNFVVSQLTSLLEIHGKKLWLVGMAGTSVVYSKFLTMFPTVEKDWDLHLLTMTSASPSIEGLYSESSLMGSFVPLGGFFSTPPEFKNPASCTNQSLARCHACNEKYEQEVADILKTNEESTSLNATLLGLQKKWADNCRHLHCTESFPDLNISQAKAQLPSLDGLQFGLGFRENSGRDRPVDRIQHSIHSNYMPQGLCSINPSKQMLQVSSGTSVINKGTDKGVVGSKSQRTDVQNPWVAPSPVADMSQADHRSSSSLTSVTTDLGLGTLYASAAQEPDTPKVNDHRESIRHFSDSISADLDAVNENTSHQIAQTSSCSGPMEGKLDPIDFKSLNQLLAERVSWQAEAISVVNRTMSLCRCGTRKKSGSHARADVWLAFLGPDRVGKKKIALALAEKIFGNTKRLISVDMSSQDRGYPLNAVFESQKSICHDLLWRKTVVDYIAGELSKQPHSVVFLENVDKADFLAQSSLLQAIRTGKFPDSHGREISFNNAIIIVTSSRFQGEPSFFLGKEHMFSEDKILEAKRYQMQLLLGHSSDDTIRSINTNVRVTLGKEASKPTIINKRKLNDRSDSMEQATTCKVPKQSLETSRSYLDLNMPLQEVEEGWFDDFCGQLDARIAFKPFNFDALAEKILKSISSRFQRTFGLGIKLEIDYEVVIQILAAAWLSEKKNSVEDWVENVLGRSFNEALQKYQPEPKHFMKLVTCEGIFVEEQAPGVCLPANINLK
ncbi:protein SMAX1-LIKE 6-like isoform X2 [Prosopis cineraria]|uniref:protein SMAX1-LIKE 6-like isoform X2 n=1 Tax=Prosopis cineraria TaxID=364024 RepID=UPI00240F148D|nr:protein SMAX1-LIKE 6-like isoform X2 [Prosopis cineraria]